MQTVNRDTWALGLNTVAAGGSQPNTQIKRHWWISLDVYVVAENPTILLIFYQALFRFAAAMECINLADQIA